MPQLVRVFIKTALVYFALIFIVGMLIPASRSGLLPFSIPSLIPIYIHMLMVGWVSQLIIGVSYWMFPKRTRENPRGDIRLGWTIYILLNVGLIFRIFAEPLNAAYPDTIFRWFLVTSALLQLAAGWLYIAMIWPRVKGR